MYMYLYYNDLVSLDRLRDVNSRVGQIVEFLLELSLLLLARAQLNVAEQVLLKSHILNKKKSWGNMGKPLATVNDWDPTC